MIRWLALLLLCAPLAYAAPVGPVQHGEVTNCADSSGQHLNYNSSTGAFSCGTSGASLPSLSSEWCVSWDSATTVANATNVISVPWSSGTITKLVGATGGTGSPSFSAQAQIGGVNVTGATATINSTTESSGTAAAANTWASSPTKLQIVISSASGTPQQAYVCVLFSHSAP